MKPADLRHPAFSKSHLRYYDNRAPDFSGRFLRWFLEHIFRLDPIAADDASVDAKHDMGVDAVYVDDVSEIVYLIQAKTKTNDKATLGDVDLKEFKGTLAQFDTADNVAELIADTKNERLKQALQRNGVEEKLRLGYDVQGVFLTNVCGNDDARNYLKKSKAIDLFDANRISDEYIDLEVDGGIEASFYFDTSDSEVIEYDAGGAAARIFLAPALNLLKMDGIADGRLFEQNVRLSLGNTKVNRGLRASIRQKAEHANFPLYHNGINVLCQSIESETSDRINIKDYVVVNGAQSLTSLMAEKSKISDGLKILVKLIEVKGNTALSQAITRNSNNQNSIKARDLKSNHNIQQRLKSEVDSISRGAWAYEIKQGEVNKGKQILSNESAGLSLLAMDLEQPWNCHQKYKIMDDLHSEIFGRPNVTGGRVLALWQAFNSTYDALSELENKSFAYYTLTKYFLSYAVVRIIRDSDRGAEVMSSLDKVVELGNLDLFTDTFAALAIAAANDLNAELSSGDEEAFDYKTNLRVQNGANRCLLGFSLSIKRTFSEKRLIPLQNYLRAF